MLDKILEFVVGFLIIRNELNNQNPETDFFASNIGKKILALVAVLMMGVVISITVVYATFQLGDAFNLLVSRYEYEVLFKIITYFLIVAIGYGVIFFFIKKNHKNKINLENKTKQFLENEMRMMILNFLEGFKAEVATKNEPG